MKVSLDSLLQTGHLGDLRYGMSQEQVQALLGTPDAVGGTTRKYKQPCIFVYGNVELHFQQQKPYDLRGFWWEAAYKGDLHLPATCEIVDWAFTPDWTFEQAEDYLRERDIPFTYRDAPAPEDPVPWLYLENGVQICFEEGRLYGVGR